MLFSCLSLYLHIVTLLNLRLICYDSHSDFFFSSSAVASNGLTRQAVKPVTQLMMSEEETESPTPVAFVERGVSVDQDGKSNVWAIEPKMETDTRSSEEKTSSALIAVGGLAALGAIAAGILTNLPDPDQF